MVEIVVQGGLEHFFVISTTIDKFILQPLDVGLDNGMHKWETMHTTEEDHQPRLGCMDHVKAVDDYDGVLLLFLL